MNLSSELKWAIQVAGVGFVVSGAIIFSALVDLYSRNSLARNGRFIRTEVDFPERSHDD